jgi:fluoroacetyl-CoA thioesterase
VLAVTRPDCASRWGNEGLQVLSTPAILGHMERLCVDTLAPHLAADQMTVGTGVNLRHLAPARLGEAVTYEVATEAVERKMIFSFRVTSSAGLLLSDGTHQRAVVDEAAFLASLGAARPAAAAPGPA